jgi:hypothetical protein
VRRVRSTRIVTSRATEQFWQAYRTLPSEVQSQARRAYARWRANPSHPSLRFRQVHATRPIYSARVGLGYRALGVRDGEAMIWFWIGPHAEYDRLLTRL